MNSYRSNRIVAARKLKSPDALSVPRWLLAGLSALALLCVAIGCEKPSHTDKNGRTGEDEQADPDVTLPKLATIEGRSWRPTFAPDGKRLLAGGGGPTIGLYEVPSGKEILTLEGEDASLDSLCFSPDGKSIVAACGWGKIKRWDAATGKLQPWLNEDPSDVGASWPTPDGKPPSRLLPSVRYRYMQTAQFTPDCKSLITTDNYAILKYWSLATGKEEAQFPLGTGVEVMIYSFDRKTLALGMGSTGEIMLWDVAAKKKVRSWKDHWPISQLSWSADGKRLASGSGGGIHVWDAASGKEVAEVAKAGVGVGLAFSPKGNLLAIVRKKDESVVVLDGTTYEKLAVLPGDQKPVRFLTFSPDGKILATAASTPATGGATKLWDASKLVERDQKRKH